MTPLLLDGDTITTHLPDSDGEPRRYLVTLVPPERLRFHLILERGDTGEAHHVTLDRMGKWVCTCKAAQYRADLRWGNCKHGVAAKDIRALVEKAQALVPALAEAIVYPEF